MPHFGVPRHTTINFQSAPAFRSQALGGPPGKTADAVRGGEGLSPIVADCDPVNTATSAPRATPTLGTDVLADTSGRRTIAVNPLGSQSRTQT